VGWVLCFWFGLCFGFRLARTISKAERKGKGLVWCVVDGNADHANHAKRYVFGHARYATTDWGIGRFGH